MVGPILKWLSDQVRLNWCLDRRYRANEMFITIDGDDIGQRITKYYLSNDAESLAELNRMGFKKALIIEP